MINRTMKSRKLRKTRKTRKSRIGNANAAYPVLPNRQARINYRLDIQRNNKDAAKERQKRFNDAKALIPFNKNNVNNVNNVNKRLTTRNK